MVKDVKGSGIAVADGMTKQKHEASESSLLSKGWITTLAYISACVLATRFHTYFLSAVNLEKIAGTFEVIEYFCAKGMALSVAAPAFLYGFFFLPLAALSWHFFLKDGERRRPKPTLLHLILPLLYLTPIAGFILFARPTSRVLPTFRSPVFSFLVSNQYIFTVFVSLVFWVIAAFLMMACVYPISVIKSISNPSILKPK
jgi:hypothetical protein